MSEDDLEDLDADVDGVRPREPDPDYSSRREFEFEHVESAHVLGAIAPRSPRAAFRFGHLVRAVRLEHSRFFANPDVADIGQFLRTYEVTAVLTQIRDVARSLAGEFIRGSLDAFDTALKTLEQQVDKLIRSWQNGARTTIPIHTSDPAFEPFWQAFRSKADSALPQDSPLRGLYLAGAAIGEYRLRLLTILPAADGSQAQGPLPNIGPVMRSLKSLPDAALSRSPLLREVTRLGDRSAHPAIGGFVRLVDPRRSTGQAANDPIGLDVALGHLYTAASNALNGLGFDTIAPAQPSTTKPRWDAGRGELWLGDELIRSVVANAARVRHLLDAFARLGWPDQINNPFDPSDPRSSTQLHQTVYDLNKHIKIIKFHVGGGAAFVRWE
jgi:hypothetical protein